MASEPPLFQNKHYCSTAVCTPASLRREARRQTFRLPPTRHAVLNRGLGQRVEDALKRFVPPVERGVSWTTQAPYRETTAAIGRARVDGTLVVEMEAAALYAFAQPRRKPVVGFADITNQMDPVEADFEKREANGGLESLRVVEAVTRCLRSRFLSEPAPFKVRTKSKTKP